MAASGTETQQDSQQDSQGANCRGQDSVSACWVACRFWNVADILSDQTGAYTELSAERMSFASPPPAPRTDAATHAHQASINEIDPTH